MNSCQSLQSIMTSEQPAAFTSSYLGVGNQLPSPEMSELPTPPLAYATPPLTRSNTINAAGRSAGTTTYPPIADATARAAGGSTGGRKFTLRSQTANNGVRPRKRITKRALTPSLSPSKRRCGSQSQAFEEEEDQPFTNSESEFDDGSDSEIDLETFAAPEKACGQPSIQPVQPATSAAGFASITQQAQPPLERPSTPKRSRIAPEQLPLGLSRADFHCQFQEDMERQQEQASQRGQGTLLERESDGDLWSVEDDRILVELVLAKMRLRPEEWRDCAAVMGRDRRSLDRRWRSLMANNHVGLNRRRAKLHATWR